MIPAEDPPVAPAVVLPLRDNSNNNNNNNNNNSDNNDGKPAAIYPIATFVNLVRTGMDHIYARAEAIAEDATTAATSTTVAVTSVRSEAPAMQSIRRELRDTQSEGDLFLPNDDEYVLIDGDLVAIPPQDEDQYECDFEARQSTKNRMRRSMKGFRKWMKKRQGKKKDTAACCLLPAVCCLLSAACCLLPMIPAEDPPVTPAVVLPLRDNSNNSDNNNNDGKPAAIYPIATFVTNLDASAVAWVH